jgi:Fe-S cluster assembly iron-binding protein IscA
MRELPQVGATEREMTDAVNSVIRGGSNAVGEVTLTASATTTTVEVETIRAGCQVFLTPLTANAATAVATTYISEVIGGEFTITHGNAASTDRSFGYAFFGGDDT